MQDPLSLEGLKSQNDHLHVLEALTALWGVAPASLLRDRIWETMVVLSSAVLRKRNGACTEAHRTDWAPLAPERKARVSYGHDVEGACLLLESCDAMGIPAALLTDHAMTMVMTMLRFGFDHRRGGVYAAGPLEGRADDRRKIWWVQAEALVACLDLYVRSGLPCAGESYLSTLDWVVTGQADWQVGEWHETVLPGGQPTGDLLAAINRDFGSFDKLKEEFANAGATLFGSGWAWLVEKDGKLAVTKTPNDDLPMKHGQKALLTMDRRFLRGSG